jgi:N-acetylglucosaminyldiphosphoundecaprenol N-acetyl-beta-D-mannosaminyltransferase
MMTQPATLPPTREPDCPIDRELPRFSVLGVRIHNATREQAIGLIQQAIGGYDARPKSVFFVNAHTLNLAATDTSYRETLNSSDYVFADGTGVRWAARLQGVRVRENLPGTDLVPAMFRAAADCGWSYYLLGADVMTIAAAADHARRTFPGWRQAGFRHGYLADEAITSAAIDEINATRPDVLLVGMGNPLQEQWIQKNLARLRVPICMGVGGLFDFWAGNVSRAPLWLRRAGHEWLWRLLQQPRQKACRYLLGNPLFLARVLRGQFL